VPVIRPEEHDIRLDAVVTEAGARSFPRVSP
jgi:5-formyltetrahydrofolate cyclo-ligase